MTTEAAHTRLPFVMDEALAILTRTPSVLDTLLRDLPGAFVTGNEGPDTWSPFDVLGHLIHGEKTDWIPRARTILEHGESRAFDKFDRFAQFEESKGKSLPVLLDELAAARRDNLRQLTDMKLTETDLDRRGLHPALGIVTLRQLLATWVAHDLDHVVQVARVMARQYSDEVGPWRQYMRIISGAQG